MTGDRSLKARTPTIAFWVPFLLILLLASGLRFYNLGTQSFWNDEGNTARLVERPIRLIIEGAAGDVHPPGYYILLHGWRALVGDSEYALRAFSALCGVLTVAVAAAASRAPAAPSGRNLAAWAAAALAAVHPLAVAYSQEARMYAQLGLATALTLWAALTLVRRDALGTRRQHILATLGLAASVSLGLYTQYAYGLALVGLNLAFGLFWLTYRADRSWRWPLLCRWVAAHALGGLLFAPWAPIALRASGWRPPDLAAGKALSALTHAFLAGTTLPEQIPPMALACAGIAGLWTLAISLHARPGTTPRFAAWAALSMALIPPALIAAAGLYRPAYLKFLMVSMAPLAVALTFPLQGLPSSSLRRCGRRPTVPLSAPFLASFKHCLPTTLRPIVTVGLLAGLVLTQVRSLQHLYTDPTFMRDDYRGIAQLLRGEGQTGDAILLSAPNQWEVFTYYYRTERGDTLPVYPAPYRPTAEEAGTWVRDVVADHAEARLFVLYWGDLESDPDRTIERALAQLAFKANDTWITSVRLARYGTGPLATEPSVTTDAQLGDHVRLAGYHLPATQYEPQDCVPLTLFWQSEAPIEESLKVFVHLVDEAGTLVAQADMEPQAGFAPTTTWQAGDRVTDHYGVLLPRDIEAGIYAIRIGMYDLSGERLPIKVSGTAVGDFFTLGQVQVTVP